MQASGAITFVSKKKNYDTIEDEELKDYVAQIKDQKNSLTYIKLSGNSYSKEFCEQFAGLLKETPSLSHLDLNDAFVGRKKDEIPFSIESITGSLIGNFNFVALDISNNAISINGAKAMVPYLEKATSLRTFLINNCGLGIDGSTIIANALKAGKVNLEVIAMARNRLENEGTKQIASALAEMTNIKEVHLYQDVIRADGMVPLLKSLMDKNLVTLDISDNFINAEAVEVFAEFLEKSKALQNLNISDCNIQEDDNEKIVEAFKKSEAKIIRVGYNHNELVDADLAKEFLDNLLSKSNEIKRIDIRGNDFKKSVKNYYTEKAGELNVLSAFESDDEDEEEEVDISKQFSSLKI